MIHYRAIDKYSNTFSLQEYIQEMNRNKMERWIHMNHQIKQREKALEIARNREFFLWWTAFYLVSLGGFISKFNRVKRPAVLTPLIPMTFVSNLID